jgi:hypothetical protein
MLPEDILKDVKRRTRGDDVGVNVQVALKMKFRVEPLSNGVLGVRRDTREFNNAQNTRSRQGDKERRAERVCPNKAKLTVTHALLGQNVKTSCGRG